MANTKSAIKMIRVAQRRRQYNKPLRSAAKTYIDKAEKLIAAGNLEEAHLAVNQAVSALDLAAERGVLHQNNAARRKSRLMHRFNQAIKT